MKREKILTKIKEKAEKSNIQSKTEVLMSPQTTSTAAAIVNYAERADLITIGTRGRTGIKRMLLGSVASAVVTYAHCAVMIVIEFSIREINDDKKQEMYKFLLENNAKEIHMVSGLSIFD